MNDFYNGPTQREAQQPATGPFEAPQTQSSQTQQAGPQARPQARPQSRFKSFQQLVNEEDDEDDEQNFFAGGGRGSGLNVENPDNPNRLVRDLLKKAENDQGETAEEEPRQPFTGVGYQLGSTEAPSRTVGAPAVKKTEKATREITFWKDGFQVGEGRLYRYDDPANSHYLNELNAGRAPLSLLDVEFGQEVVVNVMKKLDEEYKEPKTKVGGFHGSGRRLGSPVSTDYTAPAISQVEDTAEDDAVQEEEEEKKKEPEPEGDAQVQIRLADGRRVVRRVQSSDPAQTLFDFVATQTDSLRGWTLANAFPVTPIEQKTKSIRELGLVNSVVVQRWV